MEGMTTKNKIGQAVKDASAVAAQIEGAKKAMAELVKKIVAVGRRLSKHGASVDAVFEEDDETVQTLRFSISYLDDAKLDTIVVRFNDEEKPRFHLLFGVGKVHVKKVDCRELPEKYLGVAAECLETISEKIAEAVRKKAARANETASILERIKNSFNPEGDE